MLKYLGSVAVYRMIQETHYKLNVEFIFRLLRDLHIICNLQLSGLSRANA
jgi:hypothetical protein